MIIPIEIIQYIDSFICEKNKKYINLSIISKPFNNYKYKCKCNISKYKNLKEILIEKDDDGAKVLTIGGAVTIQTFIEKAKELKAENAIDEYLSSLETASIYPELKEHQMTADQVIVFETGAEHDKALTKRCLMQLI